MNYVIDPRIDDGSASWLNSVPVRSFPTDRLKIAAHAWRSGHERAHLRSGSPWQAMQCGISECAHPAGFNPYFDIPPV